MKKNPSRVLWVLGLTGTIGFALGAFGYPTWQAAVESAQVVAGIVHYPTENPFYIYHTKAWTLLHQICALGLGLGTSERILSIFLSGLLGMVSFQALGMVVFALSDNVPGAALAPALIFYSKTAEGGLIYGISLMGTPTTPGALGLGWILLALALLASGSYRLGGLLLGVSPALHPVLGAWGNLVAGLAWVGADRELRQSLRKSWRTLCVGYGVAALSWVTHLWLTYDVPKIGSPEATAYLVAFVRHWDPHRHAFPLHSPSLLAIGLSLFLSLLWLTSLRRDLPKEASFLLRTLCASALVGGALAGVHWLPPEKVPSLLLISMPARLTNLNVLAFPALALGLLARYGIRFSAGRHPWTLWVVVLITAFVGVKSYVRSDLRHQPLRDWRDDPLFSEAARGEGLLLTCPDTHLLQLRTRRPILLDPSELDCLPYVLEAGPEMNRILQQVYGEDLLDPSEAVRNTPPDAGVLAGPTKVLWESRTPAQWRQIRSEFGVTQVITTSGWKLQLPEVIRHGEYVLYQIP